MRRTAHRYLAWLLVPLCLTAGCGPIIGWTVNAFAPPKKIDPVYKPPADKKTLVFVDDLLRPVSYEPIKAELTERLNRQLADNKVAARTVPYEDLLMLMASEPDFNRLAVCEVGERLGAEVVLYVEIDDFSLKDDDVNPLWHGRMSVSVRLVDAGGARLWPDDRSGGYPVAEVEIPPHSHPSPNYGAELSKALADRMADRIARLFYRHQVSAREAAELEQGS